MAGAIDFCSPAHLPRSRLALLPQTTIRQPDPVFLHLFLPFPFQVLLPYYIPCPPPPVLLCECTMRAPLSSICDHAETPELRHKGITIRAIGVMLLCPFGSRQLHSICSQRVMVQTTQANCCVPQETTTWNKRPQKQCVATRCNCLCSDRHVKDYERWGCGSKVPSSKLWSFMLAAVTHFCAIVANDSSASSIVEFLVCSPVRWLLKPCCGLDHMVLLLDLQQNAANGTGGFCVYAQSR